MFGNDADFLLSLHRTHAAELRAEAAADGSPGRCRVRSAAIGWAGAGRPAAPATPAGDRASVAATSTAPAGLPRPPHPVWPSGYRARRAGRLDDRPRRPAAGRSAGLAARAVMACSNRDRTCRQFRPRRPPP